MYTLSMCDECTISYCSEMNYDNVCSLASNEYAI